MSQKWPQMSPTLTGAPLHNMTSQLLSSRVELFHLHLEPDLAHVICLGQWDISTCDTSRGRKALAHWSLLSCCFGNPRDHCEPPGSLSLLYNERHMAESCLSPRLTHSQLSGMNGTSLERQPPLRCWLTADIRLCWPLTRTTPQPATESQEIIK